MMRHTASPFPSDEGSPLLQEEAPVGARCVNEIAEPVDGNPMNRRLNVLLLEVEERDVIRRDLPAGNLHADAVDDVVAVRLHDQVATLLGGKMDEEGGERGLRARVKVDLGLLDQD